MEKTDPRQERPLEKRWNYRSVEGTILVPPMAFCLGSRPGGLPADSGGSSSCSLTPLGEPPGTRHEAFTDLTKVLHGLLLLRYGCCSPGKAALPLLGPGCRLCAGFVGPWEWGLPVLLCLNLSRAARSLVFFLDLVVTAFFFS